jgi:hypothetical protein
MPVNGHEKGFELTPDLGDVEGAKVERRYGFLFSVTKFRRWGRVADRLDVSGYRSSVLRSDVNREEEPVES